ncbi:MAG: 1,4-alpha-glucan branching protein GlgB, partial [Bacteroidetes bacterium]|nr:1,4-alpha-glucan branching protein GlgB [Bacteroidota bacterium]
MAIKKLKSVTEPALGLKKKSTSGKVTKKAVPLTSNKLMKEVLPDSNHVLPFSLFNDLDIELFKSGKHYRLYEKLGAHIVTHQKKKGVYFAV